MSLMFTMLSLKKKLSQPQLVTENKKNVLRHERKIIKNIGQAMLNHTVK